MLLPLTYWLRLETRLICFMSFYCLTPTTPSTAFNRFYRHSFSFSQLANHWRPFTTHTISISWSQYLPVTHIRLNCGVIDSLSRMRQHDCILLLLSPTLIFIILFLLLNDNWSMERIKISHQALNSRYVPAIISLSCTSMHCHITFLTMSVRKLHCMITIIPRHLFDNSIFCAFYQPFLIQCFPPFSFFSLQLSIPLGMN